MAGCLACAFAFWRELVVMDIDASSRFAPFELHGRIDSRYSLSHPSAHYLMSAAICLSRRKLILFVMLSQAAHDTIAC